MAPGPSKAGNKSGKVVTPLKGNSGRNLEILKPKQPPKVAMKDMVVEAGEQLNTKQSGKHAGSDCLETVRQNAEVKVQKLGTKPCLNEEEYLRRASYIVLERFCLTFSVANTSLQAILLEIGLDCHI
ncbi:PREDICTED: uncharacterized protein LOC109190910 [Ipomoea nil]|uniref:uncharacterized protein LOC109190910 n=1 Tax=Ipomoea nil TaxID=35883 RepID=UPI0009019DD9|nr:PREDICTED: uncharacterized protein LOC109190910 [Ipomoea nil]